MLVAGGESTILNFMPYLRFLPGDPFHTERIKGNTALVRGFCLNSIKEHMDNYDENNITDFISAYIREMKKKEKAREETTLNSKFLLHPFVFLHKTRKTALDFVSLFILLNFWCTVCRYMCKVYPAHGVLGDAVFIQATRELTV
jgi:hypothetical protein